MNPLPLGEATDTFLVPSPTVNVMCVDATADELAPLVYVTWEYANKTANNVSGQVIPEFINWDTQLMLVASESEKTWWNATVLDPIFEWGEEFGRKRPIFPMVSHCQLAQSSHLNCTSCPLTTIPL